MTTEIRDQIAHALDSVTDASAKQIGKMICRADTPSAVVDALNAMRTDGDIECAKEKSEWRYWLAKPLAEIVKGAKATKATKSAAPMADTPKVIRPGSRRERIFQIVGDTPMTAKQIANRLGCPQSGVSTELTVMTQAGYLTREKSQDGVYLYSQVATDAAKALEVKKAAGDESDSEGGEADIRVIDGGSKGGGEMYLLNVIANIRAEMKVGDRPMLSELHICARDLFSRAQKVDSVERELDNARALADKLQTLLNSSRHECEALRARLQADSTEEATQLRETITLYSTHLDQVREYLAPFAGDIDPSDLTEPELASIAAKRISDSEGDPAVDVKDAALGYLIRAPKRRPKIVTKPEKAVAAAMAAARNGSGRGEVFALVPVGTARRGATWSDAS